MSCAQWRRLVRSVRAHRRTGAVEDTRRSDCPEWAPACDPPGPTPPLGSSRHGGSIVPPPRIAFGPHRRPLGCSTPVRLQDHSRRACLHESSRRGGIEGRLHPVFLPCNPVQPDCAKCRHTRNWPGRALSLSTQGPAGIADGLRQDSRERGLSLPGCSTGTLELLGPQAYPRHAARVDRRLLPLDNGRPEPGERPPAYAFPRPPAGRKQSR